MRKSKFLQHHLFTCVVTLLIGFLAACTNPPTKVEEKTGVEMALVPAGEFQMTTWDELKTKKAFIPSMWMIFISMFTK